FSASTSVSLRATRATPDAVGASMSEGTHAALVLAFDVVRRRIGVASGHLRTRTASPVTTIARARDVPWAKLDAIIAGRRPSRLIVGVREVSTGTSSSVP